MTKQVEPKKQSGFKPVWDGLKFSGRILFHPFDGFWDMKHERRGNRYAAALIVAALTLTFAAKGQLTGFLFNFTDDLEFNLFYKITSVLLPFFIWCVANWCITTLVDGEGSFGDIAMVTAYAVVPLVIIQLPLVLLGHVITLQEQPFYQILDAVSVLWFALLLFCGILTIHQFSVGKTILTIGIAVLGMVILLFLVLLFLSLIQQMGGFLRILLNEIQLIVQSS